MRSNFKIGGEFHFDPSFFGIKVLQTQNESPWYASGRSALLHICQGISKEISTILIPNYTCPSIHRAIKLSKISYQTYPITQSLQPNLNLIDNIQSNTRFAILIINYFGLLDTHPLIANIKRVYPNAIVIEDCVHNCWGLEQSSADISFTSYRKTLPIFDGAQIHTSPTFSHINLQTNQYPINQFYLHKYAASFIKSIPHVADDQYLPQFNLAEANLNQSNNVEMSSIISPLLYQYLNLDYIRKVRQKNAHYVFHEGLKRGLNFVVPLEKNTEPLCLPILIKNRNSVRKKLMKYNIFLPVHWDIKSDHPTEIVNTLSSQIISLVIDQRYDKTAMQYQLDHVVKTIRECST